MCVFVWEFVRACVRAYVCVSVYMFVFVCVCVCLCVCVCVVFYYPRFSQCESTSANTIKSLVNLDKRALKATVLKTIIFQRFQTIIPCEYFHQRKTEL